MQLSVLVAQYPISFDFEQNLAYIRRAIRETQPGDLILFPEGALSGYSADMEQLQQIDSLKVIENLAIVKNIIENAGGNISFETEVGKGTIFIVEFPLITEDLA